jgi:hypothetical protein
MLKTRIRELVARRGPRQITRVLIATGIVLLIGALVLQLAIPVRMDLRADVGATGAEPGASAPLPPGEEADSPGPRAIADFLRHGLFKSATPVRDKPMADKTIERIRSQLKLQCIMRIKGEPVAYVSVKNMGLKKCRAGESVADLFTVLNIQKESIEISIIDHRVTLSL